MINPFRQMMGPKPISKSLPLHKQSEIAIFFESGDRESAWSFNTQSGEMSKVDDVDFNAPVISFSDQDHYFVAKDKQLFKNINSFILQEFGKKMFYIDQIKKDATLYATPEDRLASTQTDCIYPGMMALKILLNQRKKMGWEPKPKSRFVTGFTLPIANSSLKVLVLFIANDDFELSQMQFNTNIEGARWRFAVESYASSKKMFVEGDVLPQEQIILFESNQLLAVLNQLAPYPVERQYFGFKYSAIERALAISGVGSTILAACYLGYTSHQLSLTDDQIHVIEAKSIQTKAALANAGITHFGQIIYGGSIQIDEILEKAKELSLSESTQNIVSTRESSTHKVIVLSQSEAEKMKPLLILRPSKLHQVVFTAEPTPTHKFSF